MVWLIVGVAIAVLGVAAVAATGRLGEMPPPVDSVHPGRLPEELTLENLGEVTFDKVINGYDRDEVDALLAAVASGDARVDEDFVAPFRVATYGYRRAQVDHVFDRIAKMRNNRGELSREEMREANGSDEATDW